MIGFRGGACLKWLRYYVDFCCRYEFDVGAIAGFAEKLMAKGLVAEVFSALHAATFSPKKK